MKQFFTLSLFLMTTLQAPGQAWLDPELYPFKSHFFALPDGKMHYVDEGQGAPILFVHGTPTWSFLYRDLIRDLARDHRCIAVDHLGFGLSDKPRDFAGRPEDHARNLAALIAALDLREVTLVVHDFGGPIGLGAALAQPDRIKRVVMFNTWLWETKSNPAAQKVDRIIRSAMGRFLYLRMNFSAKVLLKKGFADRKKLSKRVHRHYSRPFPRKAMRYGPLKLGEALVGSSDWYQAQWEQLSLLEDKPWLIIWAEKDAFITPEYFAKWKERLPGAQVETLDCGHFVPEEATEDVLRRLREFL